MCGEPKQQFGMSALCVVHCALFICALCVAQLYVTYSIQLRLAPPSLCFRISFVCTWVCEYHVLYCCIARTNLLLVLKLQEEGLCSPITVACRCSQCCTPVSQLTTSDHFWLLTLYEYSSSLSACACCMYQPNVAALSFYFLHIHKAVYT